MFCRKGMSITFGGHQVLFILKRYGKDATRTIFGNITVIAGVLLALALHMLPAHASDKPQNTGLPPAGKVNALEVTQAWARATVPGQPVGAAYMTISSSREITLTSIQTDAAKQVQMHNMHMHDGVMRMRELGKLHISAGKPAQLVPGGMHLMLLGLTKPLTAGEMISMKLTFVDANKTTSTLVVSVPVRPIGQ